MLTGSRTDQSWLSLIDNAALLFERPILDKILMIFCLFAGEFSLPGGG